VTETRNPFLAKDARRVVVLGHPGHELALFGILQHYPPAAVIVISDGGSPRRVAESRRGFDSINLLGQIRYLDYPEQAFYDALLDHDVDFLQDVVRALRAALFGSQPTQVFCDAVEYYNPLHDLTLPLVRAALMGSTTAVFEVPLAYEVVGDEERYRVQRVPESLAHQRFVFELTPTELIAKIHARDELYCSLHDQAGPDLLGVSPADMAREEIAMAAARVAAPGAHGRALRYERRARLLHAEGRIARMITYEGNVAPMLDALGVPRHRAEASGRLGNHRSGI
jgi:hypothetical protein